MIKYFDPKGKPEDVSDEEYIAFLFCASSGARKRFRKILPVPLLDVMEELFEDKKRQSREFYFKKKFNPKRKYTTNKNYSDYINSSAWKKKRKEKLSEQNFCEVCGSNEKLHIHHKTYERFKHELMSDLMVLCESCHAKIHL